MIAWQDFSSLTQWPELIEHSGLKPLVIFKHSTRCSISSMVLNRLNSSPEVTQDVTWLFLDLLKHREISNHIASATKIGHESPQIIVIWQGRPIYSASHTAINVKDVLASISPEHIQN